MQPYRQLGTYIDIDIYNELKKESKLSGRTIQHIVNNALAVELEIKRDKSRIEHNKGKVT